MNNSEVLKLSSINIIETKNDNGYLSNLIYFGSPHNKLLVTFDHDSSIRILDPFSYKFIHTFTFRETPSRALLYGKDEFLTLTHEEPKLYYYIFSLRPPFKLRIKSEFDVSDATKCKRSLIQMFWFTKDEFVGMDDMNRVFIFSVSSSKVKRELRQCGTMSGSLGFPGHFFGSSLLGERGKFRGRLIVRMMDGWGEVKKKFDKHSCKYFIWDIETIRRSEKEELLFILFSQKPEGTTFAVYDVGTGKILQEKLLEKGVQDMIPIGSQYMLLGGGSDTQQVVLVNCMKRKKLEIESCAEGRGKEKGNGNDLRSFYHEFRSMCYLGVSKETKRARIAHLMQGEMIRFCELEGLEVRAEWDFEAKQCHQDLMERVGFLREDLELFYFGGHQNLLFELKFGNNSFKFFKFLRSEK